MVVNASITSNSITLCVLCSTPGVCWVMRSGPEVQHPITRLPLSNLIDSILYNHIVYYSDVRLFVCLSWICLFIHCVRGDRQTFAGRIKLIFKKTIKGINGNRNDLCNYL